MISRLVARFLQSRTLKKPPTETPWGLAYFQHRLARGVYWVETFDGGGLVIHRTIAEQKLTQSTRDPGILFGHWLCFDGDGEAYVDVLMEQNKWAIKHERMLYRFYPQVLQGKMLKLERDLEEALRRSPEEILREGLQPVKKKKK